ncbi:hypothetical protein LWI29_009368 [Acer saccharum]|uniref:Uncharacterized protein n=1 Tax=Acer saccharum TaxID=4024 RepID=A0AA39S6J1_ACESA|nr:hypothetical protein LWI29_009368 [Acer saccharum]
MIAASLNIGYRNLLTNNTISGLALVPAVKPYRKKGLKHYEILGDIFNTTTTTGQLSFSSSQVPLPSDEDREVEDNFINSRAHVNIDTEAEDDDDDEDVDQTEVSNKKKGKRHRRSIGSSGNRRKNKWESVDSYFDTAKEVMQARLEKVKVKSSSSSTKSCEQFSITKCMEALENLGNIDGDTFNKFIERVVPCVE